MKDLILENTKPGWVNGARIKFIPQMNAYVLSIYRNPLASKFGEMEPFKSVRSAKSFFTKGYYKGIWKESDE